MVWHEMQRLGGELPQLAVVRVRVEQQAAVMQRQEPMVQQQPEVEVQYNCIAAAAAVAAAAGVATGHSSDSTHDSTCTTAVVRHVQPGPESMVGVSASKTLADLGCK